MSEYCYSYAVLNRVIAQAERMDTIMSALGIDPLIAIRSDNGASWYEARTRCIGCAAESCRSRSASAASFLLSEHRVLPCLQRRSTGGCRPYRLTSSVPPLGSQLTISLRGRPLRAMSE